MAGVPTNFQAISNVLANYNFVDIASGTGYINFYAGTTVDLKLLSNFTYYSDTIYSTYTAAANSNAVLGMDEDFDTVLNRPLDLNGLGIVNVPVSIYYNGVNTGSVYVIALLRKWDGVTETEIVSNTSRTFSVTLSGAIPEKWNMMAIDLTAPVTHFKKGETLRLTIRVYCTCGNDPVIFKYGHDPKNRTTDGILTWDTSGAVPSQLLFQCPVRLNL